MENSLFSDKEYRAWINELKSRIKQSQIKASVRVNATMLELYWSIGADIVNKQAESRWGSGAIDQLSRDLRSEFPGEQGYSVTNLRLMKRFFLFYNKNGTSLVPKLDEPIRYQAGTEIDVAEKPKTEGNMPNNLFTLVPWRHHVEIIRHCSTVDEAIFFMQKTVENGWSRALLLNFLDTNLYERQGKAITNFSRLLPDPQSDLAQETLKDPYRFGFVAIAEKYREHELEDALEDSITDLLIELGKGFAYMGRQIPIKVGETEVIIDLLFYHTILHCYIVVELKVCSFSSEFIGQLGLYVSAVNNTMKTDADNPTIGLLICKTKDNVMAEWSLESSSQPIGISEYRLSDLLPEDIKSSLPSIEEIEAKLKDE